MFLFEQWKYVFKTVVVIHGNAIIDISNLIIVMERLDSNPTFPKKKKKKDQYTNNIKEPRKYENTHTR